jgi:hypothetical protein
MIVEQHQMVMVDIIVQFDLKLIQQIIDPLLMLMNVKFRMNVIKIVKIQLDPTLTKKNDFHMKHSI